MNNCIIIRGAKEHNLKNVDIDIPKNIRLAEAPSHGLPVINYDKSSRGTLAYIALAKEMLNRN